MRLNFILSIGILLLSSCTSLLFYPTRIEYDNPLLHGIKYNEVYLNSANGTRITGWWLKQSVLPKPLGTLLFFHGNGENISSHYHALAWILKEGFDYFIFDYQGYGASSGTPNAQKAVEDGLAALNYVHQNKRSDALFLFGQSLGGAIALKCLLMNSERIPVKGIILDSTFTSYKEAAQALASSKLFLLPFTPFLELMSDEWAPLSNVKSLRLPKLVFHGSKDKMIPLSLGERLYYYLSSPKKWILISEGQHIDAFYLHDKKYQKIALEWLKSNL